MTGQNFRRLVSVALKADRAWAAEGFVATDQHRFGEAWRYELVRGRIVGHRALAADHGAVLAGLTGALVSCRANMPKGCRPENGTAATPYMVSRNTAPVPDAMVPCGRHPRIAFGILGGRDATLRLESLGLTLPLAETYALVDLPDTLDPADTQDDPA